jgi:hypothetical protein
MIRRWLTKSANVFLLTVTLGAVSACAYLSGQNQSCPPVSEVTDPSTVALPPAPKPPPKDEIEPGPAASVAPPVESPPAVADVTDGGAQEGGAVQSGLAQKADGGAPKPKPVPAPAIANAGGGEPACGDRANPCPMQKFMRGTMGPAKTPEELTAAFTRASALSPNAGWQWRSIAQKGAELAKGGDAAAAKKQCKACHDQYREPYKQQYRARKI